MAKEKGGMVTTNRHDIWDKIMTALLAEGFTLIELGDAEELWESSVNLRTAGCIS